MRVAAAKGKQDEVILCDVRPETHVEVHGEIRKGVRRFYHRPGSYRDMVVRAISVEWQTDRSYPVIQLTGQAWWLFMWRTTTWWIDSAAAYAAAPKWIRDFAEGCKAEAEAGGSAELEIPGWRRGVTVIGWSSAAVVSAKVGADTEPCVGRKGRGLLKAVRAEVWSYGGSFLSVSLLGELVKRPWYEFRRTHSVRWVLGPDELSSASTWVGEFADKHRSDVSARAARMATALGALEASAA